VFYFNLQEDKIMPRAAKSSDVNKSEEIRKLIKANPQISAKEVVAELGQRGIKIVESQFYFVKGKMKGMKGRRRKIRRKVAAAMSTNGASTSKGDVLATIKKVKGLAAEVGGLKKLTALVDALSV
jgi:hypothetical protein